MKKVVAFSVTIFMLLTYLFPIALADEIDLSVYSWDELVDLCSKINIELMSRSEFKQVKVPTGVYTVGVDIPVGKWTITAAYGSCEVYWGKQLDEYGVSIPYDSRIWTLYDSGNKLSVTWDLKEGTYIVVNRNAVLFTPYVPISFGF